MKKSFKEIVYDSLKHQYDISSYCFNIREACINIYNVFSNCLLIESKQEVIDITNDIKKVLDDLKVISEEKDDGTVFILTENLFKKNSNENGLVYLGAVLTSFLVGDDSKRFISIIKEKDILEYETGPKSGVNMFDCVSEMYQFFFTLKIYDYNKNEFIKSDVVETFWKMHTIVIDNSINTFKPNNNNDITLNILKYNPEENSKISFIFRDLKDRRYFSQFIFSLLRGDLNTLEKINSYINRKSKYKFDAISTN